MERKLQYKFIATATAAIMIVMAFLLFFLNTMIYYSVLSGISETLESIADNGGELPENFGNKKIKGFGKRVAELPWQFSYYTVWFDEDDGGVTQVKLDHIHSLSEEDAMDYAREVLAGGKTQGWLNQERISFFYLIRDTGNESMVVCLDCSRDLHQIEELRKYSVLFSAACLFLFVCVVSLLSRRALEPIIRNMENQKRFITNAGHELKTPLAVISANTEVLEMMEGENEWTRSTMNQVQRLTGLVNNLVILARMGEQQNLEEKELDLSACVEAAASDYAVVAGQNQIGFDSRIRPGLVLYAVEEHIKELVNILCDNAVKYCDPEGNVLVELDKKSRGRGTILSVSNSYAEGEHVDYTKFFERFYREDSSHSSQKSGYGIGLAMAEGFVEECRGKISVHYKEGMITFLVTFP